MKYLPTDQMIADVFTKCPFGPNHRKCISGLGVLDVVNVVNFHLTKTKIFLKQNPEIFVTKADKGNILVILKTFEYIDKCSNLPYDNSTYKKLSKDPINKVQT